MALQFRLWQRHIYDLAKRNESIVKSLLSYIVVEAPNEDRGFLSRLIRHGLWIVTVKVDMMIFLVLAMEVGVRSTKGVTWTLPS